MEAQPNSKVASEVTLPFSHTWFNEPAMQQLADGLIGAHEVPVCPNLEIKCLEESTFGTVLNEWTPFKLDSEKVESHWNFGDVAKLNEVFAAIVKENERLTIQIEGLNFRFFGLRNIQERIDLLDNRVELSRATNLAIQLQMLNLQMKCNRQKKQIEELNRRDKEPLDMDNESPTKNQAHDKFFSINYKNLSAVGKDQQQPRIPNIPVRVESQPLIRPSQTYVHSRPSGLPNPAQQQSLPRQLRVRVNNTYEFSHPGPAQSCYCQDQVRN